MANVTIKNMPEKLLLKLREEAKNHQRSLNREILFGLQSYVLHLERRPTADEIRAKARAFRAGFNFIVTEEEINHWKNEGRP